jgi:hypothetical protein
MDVEEDQVAMGVIARHGRNLIRYTFFGAI